VGGISIIDSRPHDCCPRNSAVPDTLRAGKGVRSCRGSMRGDDRGPAAAGEGEAEGEAEGGDHGPAPAFQIIVLVRFLGICREYSSVRIWPGLEALLFRLLRSPGRKRAYIALHCITSKALALFSTICLGMHPMGCVCQSAGSLRAHFFLCSSFGIYSVWLQLLILHAYTARRCR